MAAPPPHTEGAETLMGNNTFRMGKALRSIVWRTEHPSADLPRVHRTRRRALSNGWRSGRGGGSPLLEALPTENWPALGWLEGDGGLLAAAGTVGPGFHSGTNARGSWSHRNRAFGLAGLATLRFVLKLFIAEEQLLSRRKDEVSAAVNTLQNLVLEFHGELLPSARDPKPWTKVKLQLSAGPD